MAIKPVLQEPDKVLRAKAKEVPRGDILSKKVKELIRDMSDTLASIEVGIGIAAPQIGESLRIFLVSEEALLSEKERMEIEEKSKNGGSKINWKHLVFINPELIRASKKKTPRLEGCLSVDKTYGKINRADKVTISAYDENGKKITKGGSGLFAQVLQHEMDHLEGVLFIDNAKEVRKISEEENEKK